MAAQPLTHAPDFTLDHVLGHSVSLSEFRGQTLVVIFGGRDTTDQVKQGIMKIRQSYGADQVAVLTVLDLRAVPRPARMVIKGKLRKGYEDMQAEVAALGIGGGVNMLVDWSGKLVDQFGLVVDQQAVGVVLDGDARILGYGAGDQLGPQILGILSPN